MHLKRSLIPIAASLPLLFSAAAQAVVVNIDFDSLKSADEHVGDDGALSDPGCTKWNLVTDSTSNLSDQFGGATPFDLNFMPGTTGGMDYAFSPNNLQDWGTASSFTIDNLVAGANYDVVLYAGLNTGLTSPYGYGFQFCVGSGAGGGPTTYTLPGVQGSDYCRFPFLTASASGQLTFSGFDGYATGLQLSGPLPTTGVDAPLSVPLLGLGLGLLLTLERRRHAA